MPLVRSSLVLVVLTLFLVAAGDARACSCGGGGPTAQRFANSDAVFVASAMSFSVETLEGTGLWGPRDIGVWEMAVTQVYKGPAEARLTVHTDITTSCAFHLDLHKPYIIFAYESAGGAFSTGMCAGTRPLAGAEEMVKELPAPVFDTARSGNPIVERTVEQLLTVLAESTAGRERLGAWAALDGENIPVGRLLAVAERSLEVGEEAEWSLAVEALAAADWVDLEPYDFIHAVMKRGGWYTIQNALDVLKPRLPSDTRLLEVYGRAMLEREDKALDGWFEFASDAEARDAVLELLTRSDRRALDRAVSEIINRPLSDPRFIPPLMANLDTVTREQEDGLSFVAWALGFQGDSTTGTLIELLSSEHEWARQSAAYGLGQIGPGAAEAIGPLTVALEDGSRDVCDEAALALERIEPGLGWPMYETWRDTGESYRSAEFLRSLQTDHAIEEMLRRLAEPDCDLAIVFGLAEAGARGREALPRLRELAKQDDQRGHYAGWAVNKIEAALAGDSE